MFVPYAWRGVSERCSFCVFTLMYGIWSGTRFTNINIMYRRGRRDCSASVQAFWSTSCYSYIFQWNTSGRCSTCLPHYLPSTFGLPSGDINPGWLLQELRISAFELLMWTVGIDGGCQYYWIREVIFKVPGYRFVREYQHFEWCRDMEEGQCVSGIPRVTDFGWMSR